MVKKSAYLHFPLREGGRGIEKKLLIKTGCSLHQGNTLKKTLWNTDTEA
jgi:hypothetical protein